jgi:hypothetical protein
MPVYDLSVLVKEDEFSEESFQSEVQSLWQEAISDFK